ncbi:MAG: NAD(P)/FAD-dependent oxidoreductase [Bacteroidia bacterium]
MKTSIKKKLVIIGGGFAGFQLARKIDEDDFDVLLIDKINHHQFQPLFYQVATSQVEPSSISFPFRYSLRHKKNMTIRLAEVTEVDRTQNKVNTNIGQFFYDILVVAIGCQTNFFGNKALEQNAFSLKSTGDAIMIRNHILESFEKIVSANEEDKQGLMNLVIVGGGPTGVELAGAFAEIKKNVLPTDYRDIDFTKFKIILIEGSAHTLNNMSEEAKQASRHYLTELGVTVYTEKVVKDYDGDLLELKDGTTIKTKTVLWAAGVTGNIINGFEEAMIAHGNRLKVDRTNKIAGSINIFAIGDIALMETPDYPKGHPQLAAVATQQAAFLAKNLKLFIAGKPLKQFEYKNKGTMATIGRNKAVVDLPHFHFKGYFAWVTWMFVHLFLILNVKNKLIIFINWAWNYVTKDTSLGLIFKNEKNR